MSTNYLVPDQDKLEWQKPIENRILTAPPTPVKGKRYIVASIATGDWVGQENNIAIYNGSTWDFIVKKEGMKLWDKSENLFLHYDGTDWTADTILYQTVAEYLDQYQINSDYSVNTKINSAYPYFWAWILGGLWMIIVSTLYFTEKQTKGTSNILSCMAISSLAIIVLSVTGRIVGFVTLEIMTYILTVSFLIIGVWFFTGKDN